MVHQVDENPRDNTTGGRTSSSLSSSGLESYGLGIRVSRGPKKHTNIRILEGYPYPIGLHCKVFIWDIPSLVFAYVPFFGP